MVFCCGKFALKVKDGTFLIVMKSNNGPQLCAMEVQNGLQYVTKVCIWRREKNHRNQIALQYKDERHLYILKVVEGTLKFEINQNSDVLSDHCWFEKENWESSEYYGLRTVAGPVKYLSIRQSRFCVTPDINKCVLVTDISL